MEHVALLRAQEDRDDNLTSNPPTITLTLLSQLELVAKDTAHALQKLFAILRAYLIHVV